MGGEERGKEGGGGGGGSSHRRLPVQEQNDGQLYKQPGSKSQAGCIQQQVLSSLPSFFQEAPQPGPPQLQPRREPQPGADFPENGWGQESSGKMPVNLAPCSTRQPNYIVKAPKLVGPASSNNPRSLWRVAGASGK